MDIFKVELTKKALKNLQKIPGPIFQKFQGWSDMIEKNGLKETQKIKGFHDEPLLGKRKGQRSVRLNKAYRAIYSIKEDLAKVEVEFILVEEVNKHEY